MIPFRCTEIIHDACSLSLPVVVGTPKISNINNYIYAIQLIRSTSVIVAIIWLTGRLCHYISKINCENCEYNNRK